MGLRRKLAWVALLYFAEGFPFGIVFDNLPVYFRVHGVSLKDIGLMGLLGLPWTLKVLWAPLVDGFGRKRTWIVGALTAIAVVLAVLPNVEVTSDLRMIWGLLLVLTIASATQDIAIDAYTIGFLDRGDLQHRGNRAQRRGRARRRRPHLANGNLSQPLDPRPRPGVLESRLRGRRLARRRSSGHLRGLRGGKLHRGARHRGVPGVPD